MSLTPIHSVDTNAAARFSADHEVIDWEGEEDFTTEMAVARLELGMVLGAAGTWVSRRNSR